MHTGLRIKAIVKSDFRKMINKINNEEAYFSEYVDQFSFLDKLAKTRRSDLIPTGTTVYMPTGWLTGEYPNEQATDGFERNIDMNTGLWTFQCCLKNYDNEIDIFLTDVLTNIIEEAHHIETKHEEDEESKRFEYVYGEIVRVV
ncbi:MULTISPECIES: hypothetical protein [Bacillus cereus group]|uniref:hypothetical protein n=1 Tax=Bacillus cereus group TaxID=86661 RepID=UPI000BF56B5A|nr:MULTISPECIES: hypothetical protein [Bacillus cereus group]MYW22855.1 hypothetical protein [Bacillus thuringiensis]PET57682.1 hypothetical protein CN536_20450 [Bacillus cereus]